MTDLDQLKPKIDAKWADAEDVKVHEIEAKHYGVWVRIKCSVAGMSDPKNVPLQLTAREKGKDDLSLAILTDPDQYGILRSYLFDRGSLREKIAEDFSGGSPSSKGKRIEPSEERVDHTVLLVRPLLSGEKFEETTYRTRKVHLVGRPPPKEKEVEILAIVTDDEKGNLVPLGYDYAPLNSNSVSCTAEDHKAFVEFFRPETIEGNIDGTIAPHIVGRRLAKMAVSLVLHSPLRIRFQKRSIPGLLKAMLLGTSTTGKSEIGNGPMEMKVCDTVTGDLSKSTGLMAAVDAEEKTVIWGVIPLADKEAIFIDSFQKIEPWDLAKMREAFRTGFVDVVKFVRARAPCRTRIFAAANASRDLDDYTNPSEGLLDCWPFQDTADIARWEIFVPFLGKDVPPEDIAKAEGKPPIIPAEVFRRHVLWSWTVTEGDLVFTTKSESILVEGFLELSKYRLPSLPLVNNDTLHTLAKISASYAIMTHSLASLQTSSDQPSINSGEGGPEEGGALKSVELINSVNQSVGAAEAQKSTLEPLVNRAKNLLTKFIGQGEPTGSTSTDFKTVELSEKAPSKPLQTAELGDSASLQTSSLQQIYGQGGSNIINGETEGPRSLKLINSVNNNRVVVTKEHAKWAIGFFKRILNDWDFFAYCNWVMERRRLTEDEVKGIEVLFEGDETTRRIFLEIAKRSGMEAGTLAEKFGLSKTWISKEVSKLKGLDLVESAERRKGYWLTIKGISYAKLLLLERGGNDADKSLGTTEEMKAILQHVEELEARSGSANLDELEGLAEKDGITKQKLKALIATMLREGILYHLDEQSVRALKKGGRS